MAKQTESLSSNLRRLREVQGISLSALARRAGISKAYLSQLENDPAKKPSVEVVSELARALNTPLLELLGVEHQHPLDEEQLPPGLRIFWREHPEVPIEDIHMLARIRCRGNNHFSPTDYWLIYETIRLVAEPQSFRGDAPVSSAESH